jgi:ribosomal protein S18 acetylase RimI-like enzyme
MSPEFGGLIYWIQSVYVRPEFRKLGCFRALFNKVLELAKEDPIAKSVRLYADKDNVNA